MKIFVTGGTGRIGRVLVEKLLAKGHSVVLLSRSKEKANELFGSKAVVLEGDLLDVGSVALVEALQKCDVVMHLAALLSFTHSREEIWLENVGGTQKLLDASKKAKIKKFIFMSSCALYHGFEKVVDENTVPKPWGAYGESKLECEKIVKASGLPFVFLRAPAVYGPGFDEGFSTVIKLAKKGKMPLLGSGKNHIALVHVSDLADALILSLSPKVKNDAFIITDGENLTQQEAFGKVLNFVKGKKWLTLPVWLAFFLAHLNTFLSWFGVKRVLLPVHVSVLTEDRRFDISKARKGLGFKPKYDLLKGLESVKGLY